MYLLDTNVISELCKAGNGKADPNVIKWLSDLDATRFYISAVTVMELELGILRMGRRDAAQGALLRTWMDNLVLPEFTDRTLPIDEVVVLRSVQLHVPNPRPERDAYIAATALVHGLTIVTRNVADFKSTGVTIINPWEAQ
jgi:predicted nucleic acid-binding protein